MHILNSNIPKIISVSLLLIIMEIPYIFLVLPIVLFFYLLVIYHRKIVLNIDVLILCIFISTYFLFDSVTEYSIEYKLLYINSVILMYINGYCSFPNRFFLNSNKVVIRDIIKLIVVSYLLYVIISFIYSFIVGQFSISRNPLNIWTDEMRPATHYGSMLIIPVAYGVILFINEVGKKRLLGFGILIFSIIFSIITATRTTLLMIPIGFFINYMLDTAKTNKIKIKYVKQIICIVTMIILLTILFFMNAFGIQDLFFHSQMGIRYTTGHIPSLSEDGRWLNISFLIANVEKSFFGGGYTRINAGNLHNVFLNIYDLGGIIPFCLFLIFTYRRFIHINKLVKYIGLCVFDKMLVVIVFSFIFIQSMLEPIMESVPVLFWSVIYLCGLIDKYLYCQQIRRKELS